MAETVHLYLKAAGADIKGESAQESLGRKDSIECVSYESSVESAREKGSVLATGRRLYSPITVTKRIDSSSPLLLKALRTNAVMEGTFKFFRPNPTGDGTTEQFYTVAFKNGRVASNAQMVEDVLHVQTSTAPPLERVSFVFETITWTYTKGGIEDTDSWSGGQS